MLGELLPGDADRPTRVGAFVDMLVTAKVAHTELVARRNELGHGGRGAVGGRVETEADGGGGDSHSWGSTAWMFTAECRSWLRQLTS